MKNDKALKIFYAEDKKSDRLLFQLALQDIPIVAELAMAEDGREAMQLLSNGQTPDLILLDVQMPYKDGFECLVEIRKDVKFDNVPVVMFTTSAYEGDIMKAYDGKANLYVQKPFDIIMQGNIMRTLFTLDWKKYFPQPSMEKFVFRY